MQIRHFFFAAVMGSPLAILPGTLHAAPQQVEQELEKAVDEIGESVGRSLERLADSMEGSAAELGKQVETWAEEHADELDGWTEKYAEKWETWADGLEMKMSHVAQDQEKNWEAWAKQYEQSWERWGNELEGDDLNPAMVGELVEKNLKLLSKMPLGQLVDQSLQDGLGELSNAPWESLTELGELAENALAEPLAQLAEKKAALGGEKKTLAAAARELNQDADRLAEKVKSADHANPVKIRAIAAIADGKDKKRIELDAKIRALEMLLERPEVTEAQRKKMQQMLAEIRDARTMLDREKQESRQSPAKVVERVEVNLEKLDRDKFQALERQLSEKILAERRRHEKLIEELEVQMKKIHDSKAQREKAAAETDHFESTKAAPTTEQQEMKQKLLQRHEELQLHQQHLNQQKQEQAEQLHKRAVEQQSEFTSEIETLRREVKALRSELEAMRKKRDQ